MAFEPKDIEIAREFAEQVTFKAQPDPNDRSSIQFIMEPEIPKDMKPKIADVIEACADYFHRSVFLGEFEPRKEDGPLPTFDNALDDINYKLNYFLDEFIYEVKRATEAEKITISPFAQEMLKYRKLQNKQKIERLKKEQEKQLKGSKK
jgi:hypothetical protein